MRVSELSGDLLSLKKVCTKCELSKSLSEFGNCAKGAGGKKSRCKSCRLNERRLYAARCLQKAFLPTVKACVRCSQILPASAFYKSRGTASGLTSYCRECLAAYAASWRSRHPLVRLHPRKNRLVALSASEYRRLSVEGLSDGYVRERLSRGGLATSQIPDELVDAKRLQLSIKRYLKEFKK